MLGNAYYHRSFIILKALDKGFGVKEKKEPAGYCKMEIKKNQGKMQIYIQDMVPAENREGIYDVLLVSTNEGLKSVKLTSIQVSEGGKSEYTIVFEPMDIQGTGNPLDKYHALAVVFRPLQGKAALQVPLVGFSSQRVEMDFTGSMLAKLSEVYEDIPSAEVEEVEVEVEVETSIPFEPVKVEEQENVNALSDWEEELQALAEGEALGEAGVEEDDYPGLEEDYAPHTQSDEPVQSQGTSTGTDTYWAQVRAYYTRLFDTHKKLCPFEDALGEVDWIRVEHIGEGQYPYYPTAAYGYEPQNQYVDHYLVGLLRREGQVRHIVYGVPGVYSVVPPMSMHGFSRWLPVKNGRGVGYWLLYIDADTGSISYSY